jgi:hypothetical protein
MELTMEEIDQVRLFPNRNREGDEDSDEGNITAL